MEFREFVKWIEEIRDRAMHEASEEGDQSLHYMQNSINLLQVAGLWIMYGVQEKSYAAQRAAEKWTKMLMFLTIALVLATIALIIQTALLAL